MKTRLVFAALDVIQSPLKVFQGHDLLTGAKPNQRAAYGERTPIFINLSLFENAQRIDQKDNEEADYIDRPEEDAGANVHGVSQARAAKGADEDEYSGPVEAVGASVIHICWLLGSG